MWQGAVSWYNVYQIDVAATLHTHSFQLDTRHVDIHVTARCNHPIEMLHN